MKNNDAELIEEARQWETVAEALDYQNAILYTVTDAMRLHGITELISTLKLVEKSADDLYALYLHCKKKHEAVYAQTEGGKA